MAERKIFAGARLRRLRLKLGISQTQMAGELSVSPSYLNLIERNQRPLTVQVLLKLSGVYGVDVAELSGEERANIVDSLKEVFSDPLISGEVAAPGELADFADAAPNAARGVTRLHEAYREALERLSDLSHVMAEQGGAPPEAGSPPPLGRATAAYFEETSPWFPELEAAAEALSERLLPRDDPAQALKAHLREAFGVDTRILPARVMPVEQARYDRHSLRLFIAERVPLMERPFLMARQMALLGRRDLIDRLAQASGLSEPEAVRLCRLGFARRLAEAVLAPAGRLSEAARELEFDVNRLSERFVLRPSRVMARLAALGAGGRGLPPAFMLLLDASGGVLVRMPGAGFAFPRYGPFCARLPLFEELAPRLSLRAELELMDGSGFRVVATAEGGPALPELPPPRRLALIGWRREEIAALTPHWPALPIRPIGVACRLCERGDCGHRLAPPITSPAAFHEHVVGPSDYEVTG
jgi:predicted transcriptional regulator/DNA-binding XRE family transcriptional regulator